MSTRTVQCVKLGRELPGLPKPPFPGPLGKRVFENVSQQAWQMWGQQQVLLINHYGLNLVDPNAQTFLMQQMEEFFFGENAALIDTESVEPPTQGGKGGGVAPAKRK